MIATWSFRHENLYRNAVHQPGKLWIGLEDPRPYPPPIADSAVFEADAGMGSMQQSLTINFELSFRIAKHSAFKQEWTIFRGTCSVRPT